MRTEHNPRILTCATAVVLALALPATARAAPLITNGGFESGFSGWITVDALGSEGTFFLQTGTTSPVNGDPVPAPPEGITAAMTDAQGPGSHVLYQDFVVPMTIGSALLAFDLFIGNRAGDFFTPSPATLEFGTPELNQQTRVDVLLGGTDPFSVNGADVLLNVFQTNPGDPAVSGYSTFTIDLSALLAAHTGQTLRLRFAETDNVFTFQLGVDRVSLETDITAVPVPEPASLLLLGMGLAGMGAGRMRRRRPIS